MKLVKFIKNKIKNASEVGLVGIESELKRISTDPGEGYVDTMVKVIIAIVIGGLLLAFFTGIFNDNVFPTVTQKITEMFGG